MRTIKFRGKRIKDNKWVRAGLLINDMLKSQESDWFISYDSTNPYGAAIKQETIGQWTGLRDDIKNDIYEGDIIDSLLSNGNNSMRYFIIFNEKEASFKAVRNGQEYPISQEWIDRNRFCVIGDIYDNPEYLNEKG